MVRFSEHGLVSLEVGDSVCPLWHVAEGPIVSCLGGLAMARGRKTSLTIRLTPGQRRTLLAWQRATTIAAGRARRGRIILLMAEGMPITDIAATVGISRRFVYKWVQRFREKGMDGLANRRERGHRRVSAMPALAESHAVSA
jgi:biotin operon repressor